MRDHLASDMHDFLRTVTVALMTTGSLPAPHRIPLGFPRKNAAILPDQIRTLDRLRLVRLVLRLGAVDATTPRTTLAVLRETLEE